MKTTFFGRFAAYIIDFIIISIILNMICFKLPDNTEKYQEELENVTEQYLNGDLTESKFVSDYSSILYQNQKSNIISSSISVVLVIGYFVVFQYMNKGQTLGKKLLKLRVVDKDTQKPTSIVKGLIRSLFILNIVSGILNIIFIYTLKQNNYFIGYGLISGIEWIFIFISIILALYRKDGRGLHDMMANTIVVKEGR